MSTKPSKVFIYPFRKVQFNAPTYTEVATISETKKDL
jgi:hypothetical protein